MAAALRRVGSGVICRVFPLSCRQQRSLNTGRGLLPRPRPLTLLLATGGGYLGYHHYRGRGQQEDGAPPPLASPTQVEVAQQRKQLESEPADDTCLRTRVYR